MKRGCILFIAVFLLLGCGLVSSVQDCSYVKCPLPFWNATAEECQCGTFPPPISDVIMRISSPSNAHGEIMYAELYSVDINYSNLFGFVYPGSITNICTENNTVLKLSDPSNAHAEGPDGTNYGIDICYGDLQCSLVSGDCSGDTTCVVKLSDTTNAHLETCDNTNYAHSICCVGVGVGEVNCSEYATKDSCWGASSNCTWTPPDTNSSPEGGCCEDGETWDDFEQKCQETMNLCTSIWAIDNQVFDQSFRLSGEQYEYCAQVTSGLSYGMWYDIDKF